MIHGERVQTLNDREARGDGSYVLYWMQRAQRSASNHALEFAIREANRRELPLLTVFGITQRFPDANARSYAFMLEGLRETKEALAKRGILLEVRLEPPVEAVRDTANAAAMVVVDRGYLRVERRWRERVARRVACPLVQVETDVVVPVETASPKEEYAAYTIRPKIHDHLDSFLSPLEETELERGTLDMVDCGLALEDVEAFSRGCASTAAPHGSTLSRAERPKPTDCWIRSSTRSLTGTTKNETTPVRTTSRI